MADTGPPRDLVVRPPGASDTSVLPLFPHDSHRGAPPEVQLVRYARPRAPHPSLVMLADPRGPQAARFRALRHRLVERGDPRVVLVTSAGAAEGKSFVASNLALAMAELRKYRVLLLEANRQHPTLARRFGLPAAGALGFAQQIAEHREQPEGPWRVTTVGTVEDLHVLPLHGSEHDAEVLDAPAFAAAMQDLRRRYEYIVIDGPPVLSGPDVNLLEDAVDALVLVARAGRTRGRSLRAALEQVLPAEVAGLVLVEH